MTAGDEAVRSMCALLGEVLDVTDVADDEDFFELGGTSLKAAVLVAQIERRFGVRLTVPDLYAAGTGQALAALLAHRRSPEDEMPVFLIHWYPADLAREIRRRRPAVVLSYGLADSGEGWPPPVGIEALAAHYVAQLRRIRPAGPYHLAGYSLGGIIAWEMARQLGESGGEMGVLCVIDAHPPEVRGRPMDKRSVIKQFAATPPRVLIQKTGSRAIHAVTKVSRVRRVRQILWARGDHGGRLELIDHRLEEYRMRPFGGRLLLIEGSRPTHHNVRYQAPPPIAAAYADLGLVTGPHRRVEIDADHFAVIRGAPARQIADAIESSIESDSAAP